MPPFRREDERQSRSLLDVQGLGTDVLRGAGSSERSLLASLWLWMSTRQPASGDENASLLFPSDAPVVPDKVAEGVFATTLALQLEDILEELHTAAVVESHGVFRQERDEQSLAVPDLVEVALVRVPLVGGHAVVVPGVARVAGRRRRRRTGDGVVVVHYVGVEGGRSLMVSERGEIYQQHGAGCQVRRVQGGHQYGGLGVSVVPLVVAGRRSLQGVVLWSGRQLGMACRRDGSCSCGAQVSDRAEGQQQNRTDGEGHAGGPGVW